MTQQLHSWMVSQRNDKLPTVTCKWVFIAASFIEGNHPNVLQWVNAYTNYGMSVYRSQMTLKWNNLMAYGIIWVDIKGFLFASISFPTLQQDKLEWNCTWAPALPFRAMISYPIIWGPIRETVTPLWEHVAKEDSLLMVTEKQMRKRKGWDLAIPSRTPLQCPTSFFLTSLPKSSTLT